MRIRHLLPILCLISLPAASSRATTSIAPLKATPLMEEETKMVVSLLETVHYLNTPVSDATFEKLIREYMTYLDEQRLFFTAQDETSFVSTYGPTLGKALRQEGRLDVAFRIFAVYRERVEVRVAWIQEQLKGDFDFTVEDSYAFERDELPWPSSVEEADALWRKRLKFELIPELLTDDTTAETNADETKTDDAKTVDTPDIKTTDTDTPEAAPAPEAGEVAKTEPPSMDERIAKAKETISKRYERLRKNFAELEAPEVQEVFLSTLTRMYDPHSTFFSAETLEDFSISMRLSLVGIGALLSSEDGTCVIKELIPGGPAILSKEIDVNDKIVGVTETPGSEPVDVIGMNLRKIVNMIRGEKGTPITLTIVPSDAAAGGVQKEVTLTRDLVQLNASRAKAAIHEVPAHDGSLMPIGVIDIPSFYGPVDDPAPGEEPSASVTQDVEELLVKLEAAGVKGIVLDLRRNGGGLLGEAVDLTGLFIRTGPVVLVRNSYGQIDNKPDSNPKVAYDGPLMVLTSRYSASASEIVAGALQNYGRAIIVGDSSTHGKGTVQAVLEMKTFLPRQIFTTGGEAGATKLTVQKFYLPNGASTQNKGVIPDISLPAIEDFLSIGEADLPYSLPWDTVGGLRINGQQLDDSLRSHLKQSAQVRVETLDEFRYLQERIDWMREREEMETISLNLESRRALKEQDETFRDAMKEKKKTLAALNYAQTEVVLNSVANSDSDAPTLEELTENAEDEDDVEFDVHLRESLRLLRDTVEIAPDPSDWTDSGEMFAAVSKLSEPGMAQAQSQMQKN
ncbi:MAG: carboxy terminal-processing peptidase [Opitutaceae bacterium]